MVMNKVVLEEGLKEKEEMARLSRVKEGRTYGEVLRGVGNGGAEGSEVTEKMEEERLKWVENVIEREKRSGKVVEMVMDLQGERSGREWKKEEVVEELRIKEGAMEKLVVIENRVKMVMKDNEMAEKIHKVVEDKKEKKMGGVVVGVLSIENWVGLVVPGMSVEMWEGRIEMLKDIIEVENGIKLMREPIWLANEYSRKT